MKRALVLAILITSGLLATSAWAHQDNSFTYQATAGMFEDMYDHFKYSPAYLSTFKKNAFWGQLSNLQTTNDEQFDNYTDNDAYMVGGQMDTGFGRAGLMIDWDSNVTPQYSSFYNEGGSHLGFGEGTWVEYRDRDGNGTWDLRTQTYGRSNETDKNSENDLYLAYSLGALDIFQLGVGVRGNVWSSDPTYYEGHSNGYNDWAAGKDSFEYSGWERRYDLITQQDVFRRDESVTGSFSSGYADWRPILAARTEALVQDLSLLVNLSPILMFQSNKYEYDYSMVESSAPAIPGFADDRSVTVTDSGAAFEYGPLPGTAFGVAADVRADYPLNPGILGTGWLEFETFGWSAKDAKRDVENTRWMDTWDYDGGLYTRYTRLDTATENYLYDQKGGQTEAALKFRFQFPAKGWRLGLGIGASTYMYNIESTQTVAEREVSRYDYYNGDPSDDYTYTEISGDKIKYKYEYIQNAIELPIGLIIDLLPNLNLQLGARHTVYFYSENGSQEELERTAPTATEVYDDGAVNGDDLYDLDTWIAESVSSSGQYHSNELMYGLTWWPYEQVQIDATAFSNLVELYNYRVSVSLYF